MEIGNPILVEFTRGNIAESFHRGAVAVVDEEGNLIASAGNPYFKTYIRSSAKPLQALPVIISGAAERFGFSPKEIALMCGSHSGEKEHTDTVQAILAKIGLTQDNLKCGIHPPFDNTSRKKMLKTEEPFTQLHHNCSGKHTAMLAGCVHSGYSIDDYLDPEHPWQKKILSVISHLSATSESKINLGIDGCGAPVHALPLYNAALAGARLVNPAGLEKALVEACQTVVAAMVKYPYMVGGNDRICTDLIRVGEGNLIAKAGAEGFYLAAWKNDGKSYGMAVKIEDGAERARDPVVLEALLQMKVLSEESRKKLGKHFQREIKNNAGKIVGEIKPVFKLNP